MSSTGCVAERGLVWAQPQLPLNQEFRVCTSSRGGTARRRRRCWRSCHVHTARRLCLKSCRLKWSRVGNGQVSVMPGEGKVVCRCQAGPLVPKALGQLQQGMEQLSDSSLCASPQEALGAPH